MARAVSEAAGARPPTLAVVIPTLNEADRIAATIATTRERAMQPIQIIVADCGSGDATVAQSRGADHFVEGFANPSRATACNAGARAVDESVEALLFLHADCVLPPRFDEAIARALRDRRVVGGAFQFALDAVGWRYRVVEAFNQGRYRITRNFYGDQGLFVRRRVFEAMGGFDVGLPIMEDADLSQRMRRFGETRLLRESVLASARRFQQAGPLRLLATYMLLLCWVIATDRRQWVGRRYRRFNEDSKRGTHR